MTASLNLIIWKDRHDFEEYCAILLKNIGYYDVEVAKGSNDNGIDILTQGGRWMIIDTYSNDYLRKVFDTKHGAGSSEYIVKAFRYYSENNCTENN